MDSLAHRKAELRAAALARRSLVPDHLRGPAAEAIARLAAPIVAGRQPTVVAGTMPFRGEVDPWPLLRRVAGNAIAIVLPALAGDAMVFRRWVADAELIRAPFGMLEPPAGADVLRPDVILLPLVGFDRRRNRLGYGRAYYDRALAALVAGGKKPFLIGLAFAVQEVASIPAEPHDMPLDCIVTETEVIGGETE